MPSVSVGRCANEAAEPGNLQAEILNPCAPGEMPQVESAPPPFHLRNGEGQAECCWNGKESCGFPHIGWVGSGTREEERPQNQVLRVVGRHRDLEVTTSSRALMAWCVNGEDSCGAVPLCQLCFAQSPAALTLQPNTKVVVGRAVLGGTSTTGRQRSQPRTHLAPAQSPSAAERLGRSQSSAGERRSHCGAGTSHPPARPLCATADSPAPPVAAGGPLGSRRAAPRWTRSLGAGASI